MPLLLSPRPERPLLLCKCERTSTTTSVFVRVAGLQMRSCTTLTSAWFRVDSRRRGWLVFRRFLFSPTPSARVRNLAGPSFPPPSGPFLGVRSGSLRAFLTGCRGVRSCRRQSRRGPRRLWGARVTAEVLAVHSLTPPAAASVCRSCDRYGVGHQHTALARSRQREPPAPSANVGETNALAAITRRGTTGRHHDNRLQAARSRSPRQTNTTHVHR